MYELGFEGLSSGPSSNQLREDFFNIMSDKMKKLKCEILEIDLRRQELNKEVLQLDEDAALDSASKKSGRKSSKSWLTNVISFKREPVEIKSDALNKLLTECDSRIVELSNIFLNEKIDLIFKHNKEIDDLNRHIMYLNRQLAKFDREDKFENSFEFEHDAQTQTDPCEPQSETVPLLREFDNLLIRKKCYCLIILNLSGEKVVS